jgi:hypothetical protein
MTTTWGAVFGDGWNGSLINPLTRAEAAARDASGEPYAAVLLGDGHVRAEIRVAWASDYLAVLCYDGAGRTRAFLEFRPADEGDLALWTERTWDGAESMTDEEFARTAARESSTWHRVDGRRRHSAEPKGDAGDSTSGSEPASAPRFSRPAFGQWSALLERAGTGWIELTDAGAQDLPTARSDEPPWRTPRPLASGGVAGSQRTISGR